jgi:hypothetical protein
VSVLAACLVASASAASAQTTEASGLDAGSTANRALSSATFISRDVAPSAGISAVQAGAPDRHHQLGLGGRVGGFTFGVGASVRYWASDAVAVQADISHYGVSDVGITNISPSVIVVVGQPDLSKATQLRPYVGGGLNIIRTSLFDESDTGIGGQGFAGVEAVFAGAPNFGVSGDIGYYSTGTFFGVSVGGIAISVAGHYYFK